MFLAIAALLLQPLAVPQNLMVPVATLAAEASAASPSAAPAASAAPAPEGLALPEFGTSEPSYEPGRTTPEIVPANAMITVIVVPVPADSAEPAEIDAADSAQILEPAAIRPRVVPAAGRAQSSRAWLALSMAQHGAATFDAWSTRRAITSGAGHELNPMLRPFAGNASLYAAIQVGPVLLDYLGRRMMTSQHGWVRHTWWVPQTLGTAMSLLSGAHNLTLHGAH